MIARRTLIASGLSVAALAAAGYSVWPRLDRYQEEVDHQRRLFSSDPTLTELVRMATLAASGHNTQPWKFRAGETGLSILPDLSRQTPVVDPDDHHLYVSLGCAAENLMIAAEAHGRTADLSIQSDTDTAIEIALKPGPSRDEPLFQAIPLRQSTRSAFDGRPLAADETRLLKAAAQEAGVSVLFFEDAPDRDAILDFVVAGNAAQMDDPAFVEELRAWLRFSPDRAIETGDGLFSACSGNPMVPDWLGRLVFSTVFSKASETEKYRDHIRSSAGIAVFIGDRADPEHWIKVGRSYQRFALQATLLGVRTAHINQPVELPALRDDFASWLGMPDARPDLVVRFGRAPAMPMSMRRPPEAVIV